MILDKTNLETQLLLERKKIKSQDDFLDAIKVLLEENQKERQAIKNTLLDKSSTKVNEFVFDLIETDKIFHIQQIKTICIDYRLRFLDSHFFKGGIPEEAISKIHSLEKNHQTKLDGFKIIAPSKTFQLLSYDDPLLFAPIGNGYYYLIHKWGNDLHPARKIMMKPFKNLMNFVIFSALVSLLFTALVPDNNLSKSVALSPIIIYLFMFKSVVAVGLYVFFMLGKNFNEAIWNRKYFNN
jgi:hypothetical protein